MSDRGTICSECQALVTESWHMCMATTQPMEEPVQIEFDIITSPKCAKCDREWCAALDGEWSRDNDLCQTCKRLKK